MVLRTPTARFASLPDFPWTPKSIDVGGVSMSYVDEGPGQATPILCLHGEPTWSFLYRKLIPVFVQAGHRVVAPDLIGFGRSDKLPERSDYTYAKHLSWLTRLLTSLDLEHVTLLCQDWGGLLGLRLFTENLARFDRVVVANTFLPTGDLEMPKAFHRWREFSQTTPNFEVGSIVARGCVRPVAPEVIAAYDAPFPDDSYKAGARKFPMLVPATPDDPESAPNRAAWEVLSRCHQPFLTAFSDQDPITRGGDGVFQGLVPGAAGQRHTTITNAGHFLQEDAGPELAKVVVDFIAATPGA